MSTGGARRFGGGRDIDWKFSRKHLMVLSWWQETSPVRDAYGIMLDGAVRSGKSLPGSCSFVLWAFYKFPKGGQDFFFAGKTIGALRRNIIRPLMDAAKYLGFAMQERRADSMLVVSNSAGYSHNFYLFGGNDESSQDLIQGFTGAGGFFDEVPLMPRSFVDQALARLSVEGATAWFTSNPRNPSHWYKTEFIDRAGERNLLYLHMTMNDNLSLAQVTKDRYKSYYSGVFYRRNILGEWCLAEGVVYPEITTNAQAVIVPDPPSDLSCYSDLFVSCDYGIQNAQVYLLFGWNFKAGRWEIAREWYYSGRDESQADGGTRRQMTDNEYYTALDAFVGKTSVRDVVIDPSAASLIALIRTERRFRVVLADNDVVPGISYTATLIHMGKLVICKGCANVVREAGAYVWDAKKAEKGDDAPLKKNDHAMDAMRYGAYTHIRRTARRYGIDAALVVASVPGSLTEES